MKKKLGFITLFVILSVIIGAGISIGLAMSTNMAVEDNVIQYRRLIGWTIFFFINTMFLFNVLFSSKFLDGKAQELLFFFSCTVLMSAIVSYIAFSVVLSKYDISRIDWLGALDSICVNTNVLYFGIWALSWFGIAAFYILVFDHSILDFSGGYIDSKLKQVDGNLENSRWLTDEEITKLYKPVMYSKLGTLKKDGVPVSASLTKNGKDMKVLFSSPCHSIIIGSTGSGKTTTFVSPMIQLLGATAAGSSMVITDPKGELFSLHSKYLNSRGYDVKVIDLRDTYSSYRWNPLDTIFDNYQLYLNANKNVYQRTDNFKESGLKLAQSEEAFAGKDFYYEFDGKAYADKERLIEAIKVFKKKTYDEVYEDLNDLCSVLIPIENDKDPMWEKGARSIVFATLLAMLEDCEDPRLEMTKEKYNFFNMTKILQNSQEDYKELRDYFKGRKKLSKALSLSKQVCDAATQTRASYMSIVYDKLTMFNDAGICALTSASDFSSTGLAERPTALFLKIPDEKDTRHNLAAIFILNIYKTLIKVASAKESLSLDRNVYFIMDEFGNMPKIEKYDKFITVGRSRKIWFTMIVQSYSQLNNVYGETVAEIVKGNCGIKMFIGSNDIGTCKEFSELCGNITVVTRSRSGSTGAKDTGYSEQTQVRPLIYPSELQRLNHPGDIGHSIIVTFGNFPLKSYFSPSFKVPFYKIGKMDTSETDRYFDESKIAYSVPERNKLLKEEQAAAAEKQQAELKIQPTEMVTKVKPETKENEVPAASPSEPAQAAVTEEAPKEKKTRMRMNRQQKAILEEMRKFQEEHPESFTNDFFAYMLNRYNKPAGNNTTPAETKENKDNKDNNDNNIDESANTESSEETSGKEE